MKLISLNTWSGVVWEPMHAFFETYKEVDIFCLQEIYFQAAGKENPHPTLDMKLDTYERIAKLLPDHVGYFRPAYSDYYGNAIFVKKSIPVTEEGDFFIHVNNEPKQRGGHSRNLQYILIEIDSEPTIIVNLHGLWNGMGKSDTEDRLNQSNRIQEFLQGRPERKIVMGDFNLEPHTESLSIAAVGLRNLIAEYGINSTRTSFYEKEGKYADYALTSPSIKILDFKVLPEEVSDHAALYLEIT